MRASPAATTLTRRPLTCVGLTDVLPATAGSACASAAPTQASPVLSRHSLYQPACREQGARCCDHLRPSAGLSHAQCPRVSAKVKERDQRPH
jgi:hypothetical protein